MYDAWKISQGLPLRPSLKIKEKLTASYNYVSFATRRHSNAVVS
jgi:hypothetical protein